MVSILCASEADTIHKFIIINFEVIFHILSIEDLIS